MRRLEGKVAIITGGGRGIGRAVALAYAREGAAVTITSRTARDVEQVASEAAREGGGRVLAFPADVTDEAAVYRMVEATLSAFGRCDMLVNAAGLLGPVAEVADIEAAEWESGIRGNLTPTFLCCRAVVPHMRRQGGGRIANLASGLAVHPLAGVSLYSAAKAAVLQFTRVLAEEVRPQGVHVFAVHPGVVRTDILRRLFGSDDPRAPAAIRERERFLESRGSIISPEQSARLFVFLAAAAANGLAGQFIRYDDPDIQARLAAFFGAG